MIVSQTHSFIEYIYIYIYIEREREREREQWVINSTNYIAIMPTSLQFPERVYNIKSLRNHDQTLTPPLEQSPYLSMSMTPCPWTLILQTKMHAISVTPFLNNVSHCYLESRLLTSISFVLFFLSPTPC